MNLRLPVLAVMLLSAVATLAPLAYATPPDPTWIAGLWDDDDHDDVIALVTSLGGAIEPQRSCYGKPVQAVVATPHVVERPALSAARSSPPPRAPPVS
jgi:hypothetical protein